MDSGCDTSENPRRGRMQSVAGMPLKLPVIVHRQTIEEYERQRGRPGYGAFQVKKGNMIIIEDEKL